MSAAAAPVPRMFAALAWCAQEATPLCEVQSILRGAPGAEGWRWLQPDDLHLTLRFHGDASRDQAEAVANELQRAARDALPEAVRYEGFQAWPGVVVAEFEAGPALRALQASLERHAVGLGFAPEARAWSPHVTLARTPRSDAVELPRLKLAPFELPVARMVLCRRATVGEARYERIACVEWPAPGAGEESEPR